MSSSIKKFSFYFAIIESIALQNWTQKKLCLLYRVKSSDIKATPVRSMKSQQKMGTSSPLTEFLKAPCDLTRQVWCAPGHPGMAFLPTAWLFCDLSVWRGAGVTGINPGLSFRPKNGFGFPHVLHHLHPHLQLSQINIVVTFQKTFKKFSFYFAIIFFLLYSAST